MAAYYNENDPHAAEWVRGLVSNGSLPPGEVDERDIEDVRASDLHGFQQVHWFAGFGGWAKAFRVAGWDDDRPALDRVLSLPTVFPCGQKTGICGSETSLASLARSYRRVPSCSHLWRTVCASV
jgi:hypothetical protein